MRSATWTPHPVHKTPSPKEAETLAGLPGQDGFATALEYYWHKREEVIRLEREDPLHYHHHLEVWKPVEDALLTEPVVFLFGGNRSSKSEFAAWYTANLIQTFPNAQILCGHTSAQSSIRMQQKLIYKYLAKDVRDRPAPKGRKADPMRYSESTGFGGRIKQLIFPDTGAACWFTTYNQSINELQGDAYDFVWCDELVPMSFLREIYYRLVSRNGKLLCTFTPIEGQSRVLADAMKGARIEKSARAELIGEDFVAVPGLPAGHMPREGRSPRGKCFWFWTEDNPFGRYDRMKKELALRDIGDKKLRAYGYVDKVNTSMFPKFCDVHVVPPEQVPHEGSCYHSMDPAAGRNWFMVWLKVTQTGDYYVYREWPDYDTYGEWATDSDKSDGDKGPAQTADAGRGEGGYKALIHELEQNDPPIIERFIDPRTAGAPAKIDDFQNTTILERLEEPTMVGNREIPGLYCTPAASVDITEGVSAINNLLDFETTSPVDGINRPRLYVSSACKNLIWTLENWTNQDGQKGACKDPADALRYAIIMDPMFVGEGSIEVTGGGSY